MNTNVSNSSPAPPNIMTALRAGFDAISNQTSILFLPVVIDLVIWLGPHIQIKQLILEFTNVLRNSPGLEESPSKELFEANFEFITQISDRINLMVLLRTYPVGIPSLMAGRQPVESPLSEPILFGVTSLGSVLLFGISILIVGIAVGTLYYQFISDIVLFERINIREILKEFPRVLIQIVLFVLILIALITLVTIPASCLLSLFAVSGLSIGQFLLFLYIGFLLWLIFPLLMTPQVIIMRKNNVVNALKNSLRVTRMTLPTTGILFAIIFLISEGLDILWRIPQESSWLTMLGILGHAFVTTSLLAATFFYFHDADRWVQSVYRKILLSSTTKSNHLSSRR